MNLVEKLLAVDKQKATERKKGFFESKRLKGLIGDGKIEIAEIDPQRLSELNALMFNKKGEFSADKTYTVALCIAAEGIVSPDLKNSDLKKHFGAHTAAELAKILFKNEIVEISEAIQNLGVQSVADETELKN